MSSMLSNQRKIEKRKKVNEWPTLGLQHLQRIQPVQEELSVQVHQHLLISFPVRFQASIIFSCCEVLEPSMSTPYSLLLNCSSFSLEQSMDLLTRQCSCCTCIAQTTLDNLHAWYSFYIPIRILSEIYFFRTDVR